MELRPYNEGDLSLTTALESDPAVMKELGGPVPAEQVAPIHQERLAGDWFFTIVPDGADQAAGIVGVWQTPWDGGSVYEAGLLLLPHFQGKGIGLKALAMVIDRARRQAAFPRLHAFPAVTNGPSNAVCEKLGFTLLEQRDLDYQGRPLRCNHWVLELTAAPGAAG